MVSKQTSKCAFSSLGKPIARNRINELASTTYRVIVQKEAATHNRDTARYRHAYLLAVFFVCSKSKCSKRSGKKTRYSPRRLVFACHWSRRCRSQCCAICEGHLSYRRRASCKGTEFTYRHP